MKYVKLIIFHPADFFVSRVYQKKQTKSEKPTGKFTFQN